MSARESDRVDADEVIERLALRPHPEGGWFVETWRAPEADAGRSMGTAIYYLLRDGETSAWHRLDADEIWHHYMGAAVRLTLESPVDGRSEVVLGLDLDGGERPQARVPAGVWQTATPLGGWSLVGCTMAPGFDFSGFELAPPAGPPPSPTDREGAT